MTRDPSDSYNDGGDTERARGAIAMLEHYENDLRVPLLELHGPCDSCGQHAAIRVCAGCERQEGDCECDPTSEASNHD